MMHTLATILDQAAALAWGLPLVIVLAGAGLLFTFSLGAKRTIQLKGFLHAIGIVRGKYDDPKDPGEITHFQALCTALSATVGLGNIAGVAVAIHVGGPGATFWMILTGFLGMATKFAECTLAIMYRKVDDKGVVHGGPMHYIELGLGKAWKPMAVFFAIACAGAAIGIGNMFQTNQVAAILKSSFGVPQLVTGIGFAIFTALVILGGIKRIARVSSLLVPFMAAIYIVGALIVIALNIQDVPAILYSIVHDAFNGTAATGGAAGIAFRTVLTQGVRRACFSNEAGLGSAPIAHSAASTSEPVREGLVALLGPFIDTVCICTMTALVILSAGVWTLPDINGVELTALAFDAAIPGFGQYFVPIGVLLFAFSTLISWSYYGERSVDYVFGEGGILPYKFLYSVLPIVGSLWALGPLLDLSDTLLALMVIPNLTAVILLLPKIREASKDYFRRLKAGEFKPNS